jgi:hypothetical protein
MLQIFLLIVTTGGIAAYARGRGGSPWLWGSLSVTGHLLIQFMGPFVVVILGLNASENLLLIVGIASWVWVGLIALCARFLLGMGMEKPDGMWSCSNCKYLNQRYAVICEACRTPYAKKA